jgi:hypothetical protein
MTMDDAHREIRRQLVIVMMTRPEVQACGHRTRPRRQPGGEEGEGDKTA